MNRALGLFATALTVFAGMVAQPALSETFVSGYGDGSCVTGTVTASSASMTFEADYCIGRIKGNDARGDGGPLLGMLEDGAFGDYDWEFIGKSDSSGSGVHANHDVTSGYWWLHPAASISGPFVISFKHGNGFSAYFFESVVDVRYGSFTLPWLKNGKDLALSHVALFVGSAIPQIPLPATALLFAVGLAGLGALRRRRL